MSSKGTIFLTKNNEHVYIETNDWSIVLQIDKESIIKIEMHGYNEHLKKFETITLENYDYIIVKTRNHYNFADLFKSSLRDYENVLVWQDSTPDVIKLEHWEIEEFEDDKKDLKIPLELRITLNKDSEWYKQYIKVLKSSIQQNIKQLESENNLIPV